MMKLNAYLFTYYIIQACFLKDLLLSLIQSSLEKDIGEQLDTCYLFVKNFIRMSTSARKLLFSSLSLMGLLDGSKSAPPPSITMGMTTSPNPGFIHCKQQDQLLLHALIALLTEAVMPLLNSFLPLHQSLSDSPQGHC